MPNRVIKESIRKSDSIDSLTWFEEVFFYRLIVTCDDYGRYDARPKILKAELFPLKDGVTLKQISDALNKLATAGMVQVYVYDQKPFLQLVAWGDHQTIRNKRSKFPAPECNCMQLHADVPVIQSESESESKSISESISESDARTIAFDAFWEVYPRKVGKQAAVKAFSKVPTNALNVIVSAVEEQKQSAQWQKDNGQYIPNPATWLNQGRWDDELPAEKSGNVFLDMLGESR